MTSSSTTDPAPRAEPYTGRGGRNANGVFTRLRAVVLPDGPATPPDAAEVLGVFGDPGRETADAVEVVARAVREWKRRGGTACVAVEHDGGFLCSHVWRRFWVKLPAADADRAAATVALTRKPVKPRAAVRKKTPGKKKARGGDSIADHERPVTDGIFAPGVFKPPPGEPS